MPIFKYLARSSNNETISGELDAENEERMIAYLQKQNLFPIKITQESEQSEMIKSKDLKIRKKELSQFTREICDMISSGVTLIRALEVVESQSHGKSFKFLLKELVNAIKTGQKFSEALNAYPRVFSPFFINLVRSGEESGTLDQVLLRLADFAEAQDEMSSKIKAALAYPVFVISVGVFVIFILLTFVVPRMTGIFEDLGQNLPVLTRVLVDISQWIKYFWWLILLGFFLIGLGLKAHRQSREGRLFWEKVMLKIPLIGNIHRQSQISRFARTLNMLIANGVSFIHSLEIVEETVDDIVFKEELERIRLGLSKGERLREKLKQSHFLPLNVINMLSIGEETGQLERSLKRIADSFERIMDQNVKLATSLLEPIMILLIGGLVGIIAMAMLLPIFQINFLIR